MTELEKLDAGLEYNYDDKGVQERKLRAIEVCDRLAKIPQTDVFARTEIIKELFLKTGKNPSILSGFNCDYGLHISVGDNFLANYNVTILDVAPVTIGDEVMIGPSTMISTVSHPMTPGGRRKHLGIARPVTIGNDVWIGGNVTILMGVSIGNNVVVAAGAVVNRDVPDNCLVAGVPARIVKRLKNDLK